jgi:prevent-host-death family protein
MFISVAGIAMIDIANDIQSLSRFKRSSGDLLERMKKTGNPLVLTINGKAELVVQDAAAYQRLCELAEKAVDVAFLAKSKADVDAGRVVDARRAIQALGKRR